MKLPRIWTIPNPSGRQVFLHDPISTHVWISFFHWFVMSKIFPENCELLFCWKTFRTHTGDLKLWVGFHWKKSLCVCHVYLNQDLFTIPFGRAIVKGSFYCNYINNYCEGTRVTDTHHLLRIFCWFLPLIFPTQKKTSPISLSRSCGNWSWHSPPSAELVRSFPSWPFIIARWRRWSSADLFWFSMTL